MATLGQARDTETPTNSVAALGLRRAALRGMLGSPLIEADDQRELREELLGELQSVGQTMSTISARNAVELCAKLDALNEEYRPGQEGLNAQALIASIRRDVMALMTRQAPERSPMHAVRTLHTGRPVESPQPAAQASGQTASAASSANASSTGDAAQQAS
jgi:hypothetical protein